MYAFNPLLQVIKLVDSDTPCWSKVYPRVEFASKRMKEVDYGAWKISFGVRWEGLFNNNGKKEVKDGDVLLASYCCDPEFQDVKKSVEAVDALESVVRKLCLDDEDETQKVMDDYEDWVARKKTHNEIQQSHTPG
mmetsp:Transcript_6216/g.8239  ORF Transcript_6216/g.8239 Transcript_6216/m.8239 type:complete len:135 (+) Transcript_6216:24-428(+)